MRAFRLAALAFLLLAQAKAPPFWRLATTIPLPGVEGRIDHFTIDAAGQRLFAAALGNNTVEVIDLKSGKRIHSITGLPEPQGVAFAPETDQLFVSNGGDGSCLVFDGKSFKPLAKFDFTEDADNLRYDKQAGNVYVGFGNGAIGIIDAKGLKQAGEIKLSGHPEAFELEKSGDRIFINVPTVGAVEVADEKKKALVARWPVKGAQANFPVTLDETHHRLFVGCRRPPEIIVFDTQSDQEVGRFSIDADVDDIFYDGRRKWIYVVCGAGFIDIFQQVDADRYQPTGKIPTASGARTGLFVPEENQLYLAVPHRGRQEAEIRVYEVSG